MKPAGRRWDEGDPLPQPNPFRHGAHHDRLMVTVRIPAPLRPKADGNAQLDVQAATLQEAVESVVKTHPDLGEHMLADDGTLHRFVNYFVNGTDVRQLDGPETEVSGEDTILVLPAVAGGSREAAPELTPDEMRFYGRHIILPDVGQEGQEKLKESSALLIGAGVRLARLAADDRVRRRYPALARAAT